MSQESDNNKEESFFKMSFNPAQRLPVEWLTLSLRCTLSLQPWSSPIITDTFHTPNVWSSISQTRTKCACKNRPEPFIIIHRALELHIHKKGKGSLIYRQMSSIYLDFNKWLQLPRVVFHFTDAFQNNWFLVQFRLCQHAAG